MDSAVLPGMAAQVLIALKPGVLFFGNHSDRRTGCRAGSPLNEYPFERGNKKNAVR
jgi:hypothetical protein